MRLGATWIDKEYIQQFMYETFNTPYYLQRAIQVNYASYTAEWQVTGKSSVSEKDVAAYTTYGTSRANAYKIFGGQFEPSGCPHLRHRGGRGR